MLEAPISPEILVSLSALYPLLARRLPPIELREVLEAAAGWKVARVALGERAALAVVPALRAASLEVSVSAERYVHRPDSGKGGWSNSLGEILPGDADRGDVYVYVARGGERLLAGADADAEGDSEAFGEALGIPGCCRRAYADRLASIRAGQNDPVASTIAGTASSPPHAPWTNVSAQYFHASLLSFAPCSLDCAAAAAMARRAHALLGAVDDALAARFLAAHASDIVYSEWQGVHRLHGGRWAAGVLRYAEVESTAEGPLAEALRAADGLVPEGVMRFRLLRGETEAPLPAGVGDVGLFLCGGAR